LKVLFFSDFTNRLIHFILQIAINVVYYHYILTFRRPTLAFITATTAGLPHSSSVLGFPTQRLQSPSTLIYYVVVLPFTDSDYPFWYIQTSYHIRGVMVNVFVSRPESSVVHIQILYLELKLGLTTIIKINRFFQEAIPSSEMIVTSPVAVS
jgi:hypothetical protein